MEVPLLDLRAQHAVIKDAVMFAVTSVIDRQQFIMGPRSSSWKKRSPDCRGSGMPSAAPAAPMRCCSHSWHSISPGDEVITPAFTFFATAGTVHNTGGTPVFVDIEPGTFNVSPEAIEAAITPRTRAIVVVHLYGQMAAMEKVLAVASARGIPVIEDAAQAIGARRKIEGEWRMAGETGWVGTLSFFPSKNLGGWGDGGMILTQEDELAGRLRRLRLHGGARQYHHDGRDQQSAGHGAGRGAAGQDAVPGRVERRPAGKGRRVHPAVPGRGRRHPAPDGSRQRAHFSPVHPAGFPATSCSSTSSAAASDVLCITPLPCICSPASHTWGTARAAFQ